MEKQIKEIKEKYKNTMLEYIPRVINRISNVGSGYLLVGRKIFAGINILLVNLNMNIQCDNCDVVNKCLNLIDVPEFLTTKNIIADLYLPNFNQIYDQFTSRYESNKNIRIHSNYYSKNNELKTIIYLSWDKKIALNYVMKILKASDIKTSLSLIPLDIKQTLYYFFLDINMLRKLINYKETEIFDYRNFFNIVVDKTKINKQLAELEKNYKNKEIQNIVANIKKNFNTMLNDHIIEEHNMEDILKLSFLYDIDDTYDENKFLQLMIILKENNVSVSNLQIFNTNMQNMVNISKNYYILLRTLRMFDGKKQSNIIVVSEDYWQLFYHVNTLLLFVYLQTKLFKVKYINKWDDNICVELK